MHKPFRITIITLTSCFLVTLVALAADEWITGWGPIAPLPHPLAYHRVLMHRDTIYVIGGEAQAWVTPTAAVLQAAVDPANGSIRQWVTPAPVQNPAQGTPTPQVDLPLPLHRHAAVKVSYASSLNPPEDAYSLYVIGGWRNGVRYSNVWRADWVTPAATPQLYGWTAVRDYPRPIIMHEAVFAANHIYVLGGLDENDQPLQEIYRAQVGSSGDLGPWTATTKSLPSARSRFAAVTTTIGCEAYMYLVGGDGGTRPHSEVYFTKVEGDGDIKMRWERTTALPQALYHHQALIFNDKLVVLGGKTDDDYFDQVYSAKINADGHLGLWSEQELLPNSLYRFDVAIRKDDAGSATSIYVVGGKHYDAFQSQVYLAAIDWSVNADLRIPDAPVKIYIPSIMSTCP